MIGVPTLPLPTIADVRAAAERIKALAVVTPLIEHPALNQRMGGRILLKAETMQRVGAFKFRGAYNAVSQVDKTAHPGGVVACSSGNHAQGVAHAATLCGMPSLIVMPQDAPALKIARTKAFGAEVVTYDRATQDRDAVAMEYCQSRKAALIHPYDDPRVMAGQGTAGLELMAQAKAIGATPDAVVACCGGGGLMTGIAIAVKDASPSTEIYGVEPEAFDDFARSMASGKIEKNAKPYGTICDALMTPWPGRYTFAVAQKLVKGITVVTDEEACDAVRYAFTELKLVLEPGGAVGLAAILSGKIPAKGRTIAVTLSGGNVDPAQFARIIQGGQ